jgi:hypothetical protein
MEKQKKIDDLLNETIADLKSLGIKQITDSRNNRDTIICSSKCKQYNIEFTKKNYFSLDIGFNNKQFELIIFISCKVLNKDRKYQPTYYRMLIAKEFLYIRQIVDYLFDSNNSHKEITKIDTKYFHNNQNVTDKYLSGEFSKNPSTIVDLTKTTTQQFIDDFNSFSFIIKKNLENGITLISKDERYSASIYFDKSNEQYHYSDKNQFSVFIFDKKINMQHRKNKPSVYKINTNKYKHKKMLEALRFILNSKNNHYIDITPTYYENDVDCTEAFILKNKIISF